MFFFKSGFFGVVLLFSNPDRSKCIGYRLYYRSFFPHRLGQLFSPSGPLRVGDRFRAMTCGASERDLSQVKNAEILEAERAVLDGMKDGPAR